jgi:hypothetical protein
MRKLVTLLFLFVGLVGFAQVCPTPSTTGAFVTLDATYQLATTTAGSTDVGLCFYNNTSQLITAAQFRVFYDINTFSGVSDVTSLNTSYAQYLQFVDNPTAGYVTITMSYTGNLSSFTIPNGAFVKLNLTHVAGFASLTSTTPMTFSGVQTFPQTATTQAGMDYALNLQNFGGVFLQQLFSYSGTFTNVTGSGAKNIPVILEKKLMTASSWTTVTTSTTDVAGNFTFTNLPIDITSWDVRIRVDGSTLATGNIISVSDSQKINRFVLGQDAPTGFDFYTADANGDNNITVSDVYSVFGRVSGRFTVWPNLVKDVKFFSASEYASINGTTSSLQSTIPGVTDLVFNILPGSANSVTFYVAAPGDANGTGFQMARMTPIEILNPANAPLHIIDVTTTYDDNTLNTIEVHYPNLSVNEENLVEIPVSVKTNGQQLGSLQLAMNYNSTLLDFRGIKLESKIGNWVSFMNPNDNVVEWGGYDPTLNTKLLQDNELAFTLQFISRQIQSDWGVSPLYVTRKHAGNPSAKDLKITPTDGIVSIMRVGNVGTGELNESMMVYPNPVEDLVNVRFRVTDNGSTWLGIYSLDGKELQVIVNKSMPKGDYNYMTSLGYLPSGEYIAVLRKKDLPVASKIIIKK